MIFWIHVSADPQNSQKINAIPILRFYNKWDHTTDNNYLFPST